MLGHPVITHKDYNDQYMVDTRGSRDSIPRKKKPREVSVDEDGAPKIEPQPEPKVKEERKSKDSENNKNIWETNQNYISGGSDSEDDEEKPTTIKKDRSRNGKKSLPLDDNSEAESDENQAEAETEDSSDNGVKSIQLGQGDKKLDVIMLFE